MRDIGGFVDTRYRLLQLRSNNRNNWISFAIAHHLDGNHELCVQILSAYESTLVSWHHYVDRTDNIVVKIACSSGGSSSMVTLAIAHHPDGNHELCVQILSAYESTLVIQQQQLELQQQHDCVTNALTCMLHFICCNRQDHFLVKAAFLYERFILLAYRH
jgi:hypothetical protein